MFFNLKISKENARLRALRVRPQKEYKRKIPREERGILGVRSIFPKRLKSKTYLTFP